jgi:hypothetical protein
VTGSVIGFGCLHLHMRFAARVSREPLGCVTQREGELVVLRCTKKLQDRLHVTLSENDGPWTNALGPWYGNLIHVRRQQFVMLTNETTFLTVVVPAREGATVVSRTGEAIARLLITIGIDKAAIEQEQREMQEVKYSRTMSRTVLGVMNDFGRAVDYILYDDPQSSLDDLGYQLAGMITSALKDTNPMGAARDVFSKRHAP